MFSDGGLIGTSGGWLLSGGDNSPATGTAYRGLFGALGWAGVPLLAKFFFELVFCGTSATIVSGSVNERMKYSSFLVFSLILTAIIYPVAGHWVWGGGFLARAGMKDRDRRIGAYGRGKAPPARPPGSRACHPG